MLVSLVVLCVGPGPSFGATCVMYAGLSLIGVYVEMHRKLKTNSQRAVCPEDRKNLTKAKDLWAVSKTVEEPFHHLPVNAIRRQSIINTIVLDVQSNWLHPICSSFWYLYESAAGSVFGYVSCCTKK